MRKTFIAILLLLLASGAAFAQYIVNFEGATETKPSYASGSVTLNGVSWNMTEALIGTEAAEIIAGTRSARLRGHGTSSMTMLADKANGIGSISFQYRRYGTDAQVDWKVEYSTDSGANWTQVGSAFTAPATTDIITFNETVNVSGNVRVRIKRATESGTSNRRLNIDDITITDYTGGTPTPTITVTGSLNPFSTLTGSPSAAQSYTLSGANLTENIAVLAPTGFVLSTDQTTWTSSLSLASTFNGLVYVRMTGATAGEFNGNITHNSTGAAEVTQAVSGSVSDPIPQIFTTGTPTAFSTLVGTPSASQQYNLTAAFLTANITITAPAGFEISTDGSNYSAGLSVAPNYNGQIYVRLTGTTVGTYDGNILHSSTGATDVNVAVSGTVTEPLGPTTFLEENFNYTAGTLLTNNGWTAHSGAGTQPLIVGSSGLTYPAYPASSGLSAQTVFSGSAEDVNRTFTLQTSGNVYASFLINSSSLPNVTGDYIVHFGPSAIGTEFRGRVFVQRDSDNNIRFGITKSGAVGSAVWTDYTYSLNQTYLIALKYIINPGTANDEVLMWVNPAISGTEPSALLTASDVTGTDATNIGSIAIRQGTNTPIAQIDGIRVTNDWAQLWSGEAPEPPVLYASPTVLDPLEAIVNSASDETRSYTLYGTNLVSGISVVAPEGFQLSTTGVDGWDSSLSLGSGFNGTIYVRMYAGISGTYSGAIVHTSNNADPVNVLVSGEAFDPPTTWNIVANLVAFASEAGTASAAQSYTLSATDATQNLEISVGAPFELSTTEDGTYTATLSLDPTFNGSVWVRMNSAAAGTFNSSILHATTNASDQEIPVSGEATPPAGNYAADLFFSEYIEGSSNNKALEIFNGTGVPVDLGNYKVYLYSNGASTPSTTNLMEFTAGTMLPHGDVYVIANAGANAAIQAQADVTSTVTSFNGDDAVALVKVVEDQDVFVDIFGMIGQDPDGSPTITLSWTADGGYSTQNKTLVRKPTVTQGVSVNPTGYANGDPAAFETLATEWDVYAQDTTTYLGSHTFAPGMPVAVAPVMNPAGGIYSSPINVSLSTTTPSATIYYTLDGSIPSDTNGTAYTTAIPVSATTTLKAIAYATGFTASSVSTENYVFPTLVATIAVLRAMPTGATMYQLTGEAILTFQQGATRYTKYVQDATAAIVIDDPAHIITTAYNLDDGITGITGTLGLYNGLLQFTPVADPGAATSTGNVIVPELRTLASLTTADQGKLVKIENVMVDATNVTFGSIVENINVTDPTATLVMRTFPATDYSSTAIPTVAQDIICLVGQYNATMQISPRFLADFSNHSAGQLETPVVTISVDGSTISLNWPLVDGASTYLVEGATDPYGTYTTIETVNTNTWSGAAEGMKFFKVTAQP